MRCGSRKPAAAGAKLNLTGAGSGRARKQAVALEDAPVEEQIAVGGKARAVLRLEHARADGRGSRIRVGAAQQPLPLPGLGDRKGSGAVVREHRTHFIIPRGTARKRERARACADKRHRTCIGKDESGVVLRARSECVVSVVSGGVERSVSSEGEQPVAGEGGRLGELDEAGVGAGVLEGAAVEHQVGGGAGGGADGAGQATVGQRVDRQNGATAEDGRTGVGVQPGEKNGAGNPVADDTQRTAARVLNQPAEHAGAGGVARTERNGGGAGAAGVEKAGARECAQRDKREVRAVGEGNRGAGAGEVQDGVLPEDGGGGRTGGAEGSCRTAQAQGALVEGGVAGVGVCRAQDEQSVTGLGEAGRAGAEQGVDGERVGGIGAARHQDKLLTRARGQDGRTAEHSGARAVVEKNAAQRGGARRGNHQRAVKGEGPPGEAHRIGGHRTRGGGVRAHQVVGRGAAGARRGKGGGAVERREARTRAGSGDEIQSAAGALEKGVPPEDSILGGGGVGEVEGA